jgi:hypothetical protein
MRTFVIAVVLAAFVLPAGAFEVFEPERSRSSNSTFPLEGTTRAGRRRDRRGTRSGRPRRTAQTGSRPTTTTRTATA